MSSYISMGWSDFKTHTVKRQGRILYKVSSARRNNFYHTCTQLRTSKQVKQVLMIANKGLSSKQEQRALSRTPLWGKLFRQEGQQWRGWINGGQEDVHLNEKPCQRSRNAWFLLTHRSADNLHEKSSQIRINSNFIESLFWPPMQRN